MKLPPLPPLVGEVIDGSVTWEGLTDIDYSTVGYLLCCHLVIENYLDAFIQARIGVDFSIKGARLTFGQKVSLLTPIDLPKRFNFISTLKHLNSLRNKLGHNIRTIISEEELLPLIQYLEKSSEKTLAKRDAISVLRDYTGLVCAWMAASYVYDIEGRGFNRSAAFEKWARSHFNIHDPKVDQSEK